MSFGAGYALIQGAMGAMAGAGQGMADESALQEKAQIEALREQRLSSLRIQEHATETQGDLAAKQAVIDTNAAKNADFYKNTTLPDNPKGIVNQAMGTFTTDDGQPDTTVSNEADVSTPPTREAQAAYRADQAKLTGRPELMRQTYDEDKDIRADADQKRKSKVEADKQAYYNRKATNDETKTDIAQQKVDALLANLSGSNKPTAQQKNIESLTEYFGGDEEAKQKAISMVYGTRDKPRSDAIQQVARTIGQTTMEQDPDKLYARAAQIVDGLRAKDVASRGGVTIGGDKTDPGADLTREIAANAGTGTKAATKPETPAVAKMPDGTALKFSGRYSALGKPIYLDPNGKEMIPR